MTSAHAHGPVDVPLLGETIGANLRRTVERVRRRARRSSSATRATARPTAQLWDAGRPRRARPAGPRRADRATASASGRRTATSGSSSSTPPPASARSSSTSTPRTRRPSWSTPSTKSGVSVPAAGARLPADRLRRRCSTRSGTAARPARGRSCSTTTGTRSSAEGDVVADARARRPRGDARSSTTRSTSSTPPARPGFPKGATLSHHNILNNGYFVGARPALHRARPRLHPGAVLPLLRHGARQPRLHHARRLHGRPGRGVRRRARCSRRSQAERCTSLYGVPTMFIAELDHPRFGEFDLSTLRTGIMAGAPCPVELMRQVRVADAHGAR